MRIRIVQKRNAATMFTSICLLLPFSGCGFDRGRELVNAAGLSTNAVLSALGKGADVNQPSTSTFGWTPLMSAIYHHQEEVVELLVARGADVNLKGSSERETPLIWAVDQWGENTNLVFLLLKNGADPNIKDRFGSSAYDRARMRSNSDELLALFAARTSATH
jgi:ankyrin repeat protein